VTFPRGLGPVALGIALAVLAAVLAMLRNGRDRVDDATSALRSPPRRPEHRSPVGRPPDAFQDHRRIRGRPRPSGRRSRLGRRGAQEGSQAVTEEQAWAEADPRWARTALALRLAREAGVAPSSLLLTGADDLRSNRLAALDVAAARLGVRLVIPLGVAFLPAFVLTTIVPVVLALAGQVLAS
jgi:hypothetical protein